MRPRPRGTYGALHIAFLLDGTTDLDRAHRHLAGKGFVFTVAPKTASSGSGRLAFFTDASGVSIELIQRNEDVRKPYVASPYLAGFDHLSVLVAEGALEKWVELYTGEMGFKFRDKLENGTGGRMDYYTLAPDTIEVVRSKGTPDRPLNHISFRVTDCRSLKERLDGHGISCGEPRKSHFGDFSVLHAAGPDGEQVEFHDRKIG